MEQARINNEHAQILEDLKPGSGKIWQNKLTVPSVPKITGLKPQKYKTEIERNLNDPMIIE